MKILFAIGSLSRLAGGLFFSVCKLAQAIAGNEDVRVEILGAGDEHLAEDRAAWGELSLHVHRPWPPRALGYRPGLSRRIADIAPDVVDVQGIWMGHSLANLRHARKASTPYVVTPHGMLDPWAVQNSAWKKKIVGWLYENEHLRRAACIRALCRSELESIRTYGLDNPVCVVPNGVDLPDLPESPREEGGRRKLLFLGRIHPKKGVKELLDGWVQWQEHGGSSDWQLLIAGWDDGGHLPGLKSMAARCAPESVQFVGPVYGPRKAELLRGVDAFILPSFSEGLPMAVLEAWSYRLPVIMTRHCNLPAGFEVGAAVRVDPDGESVARGLQQLASMSLAERRAMGSRGRELVAERFTWPTVAQQMLAVYRWIWGAGTVPPCVDKG